MDIRHIITNWKTSLRSQTQLLHWKDVVVLWSAFFISLGCGTLYVYSAYSTQLAERLELTTSQAELVGLIGSTGVGLMSTVAGVLIDKTGHKIPIVIGATLLLLGYFVIYIAYEHRIGSVFLLAVSLFGCGFGGTLCFMSAVKIAAICFPNMKGTATAIPLAAFGLSALFFTLLWAMIDSTENRILSLSLVTSGLAFFHLPFLGIKAKEVNIHKVSEEEQFLVDEGDLADETQEFELQDNENANSDESRRGSKEVPSSRLGNEDVEQVYILRRRAFWELYFLMSTISGIGQMYIYSCGYTVRALLLENSDVDNTVQEKIKSAEMFQVALISFFNFASRIVSGSVSDYLIAKEYQRLWLMVVSAIICCGAQILAQFVNSINFLWIVSIATGSSYGLVFGVFPSITSETFGNKNFSQNMGWLSTSYVFSSFIFNTLFGKIYDSHSNWNDNSREFVCKIGIHCYSGAFLITMFVSMVSVIWGFYMIYAKRLLK